MAAVCRHPPTAQTRMRTVIKESRADIQRDCRPSARAGTQGAPWWRADIGRAGPLAQLVDQRTFNPLVTGSNPVRPISALRVGAFPRAGHILCATSGIARRSQHDPEIRRSAGQPQIAPASNAEKDPADWTTGDEPMTGAQASYLKTLCEEAKEPFDETLTKADASRRIDELQQKTGRGKSG